MQPKELARHYRLSYTDRNQRYDWHLVDAGGAETIVTIGGNLETNNPMMLRAGALAGLGVVLLPLWIIGPDIKAGRLQRLLPDYHWPDSALQAVRSDESRVGHEGVRTCRSRWCQEQ